MLEEGFRITRDKDKAYYITNWGITVFCTVMVAMLRMSIIPSIIGVADIPFSTTDFFFIVCTSLCGFVYGVAMFSAVVVCELIILFISGGFGAMRPDSSLLFSIFLYMLIVLACGYFSSHRWYAKRFRTFMATIILMMILTNSWYMMFVVIPEPVSTAYADHDFWHLAVGSNPEVVIAVVLVYLLFRFLPDKVKIKFGMGHLYTLAYRQYLEDHKDIRKTTISSKVTVMSLIEAVLLSVICVIIFDFQLTHQDPGHVGMNETIRADKTLFGMNFQLILLTLSVSLPIAVLFNEIILRIVVLPINRISNAMDKFFSGDKEELTRHLDMVDRLHINSGDEMEKLYNNMRKMVRDMNDHIDALEKERQLEADLEVAEAKSEAKSAFLSNVSHEIRTPINAVLGMNEMILRESEEENTLYYAENIRTAGNSLLGLVNDILDFSKIEAGKMDIIEVDYEFASTLNDLVNMISTRAADKGLELIVNVNPGLPSLLHGDEIRIKQVVTNILTNAVKYTEKGSVTMSVDFDRNVEDDDSGLHKINNNLQSGDEITENNINNNSLHKINLKVAVKDTGIGIREEDLNKLFSAFERIEEERNRNIEGTGLGMNITQTLLDLMGSRLEVQSVYGEGSCFSFSLVQGVVRDTPIGDYEEAFRRSVSEHSKYRESFTAPDALILITDDTKMNLTVIENLLKRTQIKMDFALSGDECISKTLERKYDMILLDHRMPEKDGIQTLAELKAMHDNPNLNTPVICLTANAVSGAREEYLAAGFTDYITKPVNPANLEKLLMAYLPEEKVHPVDIQDKEDRSYAAERSKGSHIIKEDEESELPDFITHVSELDIQKGISNCGDAGSYISALRTYAEAADDNLDSIEGFFKDKNYQDYTIRVHALKSSSRIIGAEKIGSLAELMENAGNAGDAGLIEEKTPELLDLYRELTDRLRPLVMDDGGKTDKSDGKPISEAELKDAYDALKEMSLGLDHDGFGFILDSLGEYRLPEEDLDRYNRLRSAARKFDWDQIGSILKEV
ncbi:MAG: response regulator [Lachnospiraceae bacterium]|nr:response regulator [Lachnospiraceae bacterium]